MATETLLETQKKRGHDGSEEPESPKRSGCMSCFKQSDADIFSMGAATAAVDKILQDADAGVLMPTADSAFVQFLEEPFGELLRVYDGDTEVVGEGGRSSGDKERNAIYASVAHMLMAMRAHKAKADGEADLLHRLADEFAKVQGKTDTLLGNAEPPCAQDTDSLAELGSTVLSAIDGGSLLLPALVTLIVHDWEKLVTLRPLGEGPARTVAKLSQMRRDGFKAAAALADAEFDAMTCGFLQNVEIAQDVQGEKSGRGVAAAYSGGPIPQWFAIHCLFDTGGVLVNNTRIPHNAYFRSPILTKRTCAYFLDLGGRCAALSSEPGGNTAEVYNKYIEGRTLGALGDEALAQLAASMPDDIDAKVLRHALGRIVCMIRTANPDTVRSVQRLVGVATERYGAPLTVNLLRELGETEDEPLLLKYAPTLLNTAAKSGNDDEFVTALAVLAGVCAVGPMPSEGREICLNRLVQRKPDGTPANKAWFAAWARVAELGAAGTPQPPSAVMDAVACARYADLATRPDGHFLRSVRAHAGPLPLTEPRIVKPAEAAWDDDHPGFARTALVFEPCEDGPGAHTIRTLRADAQRPLYAASIALFAQGMAGDETVMFAVLATLAMHPDGLVRLSDPYANDVDDVAVLALYAKVNEWAASKRLYVPSHARAFLDSVQRWQQAVAGLDEIADVSLTHRPFGVPGGATVVAAKPCHFRVACERAQAAKGIVYVQGEPVINGSKPYSNGRGDDVPPEPSDAGGRQAKLEEIAAQDAAINRFIRNVAAAPGRLCFLDAPRTARAVGASVADGALAFKVTDDVSRAIIHAIVGGERDAVEATLASLFAKGGFTVTAPMKAATARYGGRTYLADCFALMAQVAVGCEGVM